MGTLTKEQGINISLSTVVSLITVGAAFWLFAKPLISTAVAAELKDEIQKQVRTEVKPLSSAFTIILQNSITDTRRQVTALQYKRRTMPDMWTLEDEQMLSDLEAQLDSNQKALEALKKSD